jgi:hypothetical protein
MLMQLALTLAGLKFSSGKLPVAFSCSRNSATGIEFTKKKKMNNSYTT